jgi:HAD superfamily hydrolase (TIGR01490 family)
MHRLSYFRYGGGILEKLAIFDVDYTLTSKETLGEFLKFMIKKDPRLFVHVPKSLGAAFLYVVGIFSAQKAKEHFLAFVDGIEEETLQDMVKEFYETCMINIFYSDAIEMIRKLKTEGCKIILISASAEFYLNELYGIEEVDKIIGTKFKVVDGKQTRIIEGENCKGDAKVVRLMEYLKEEKMDVDFKNSYMFSDSMSDSPLFHLVGHPYLINYKKKQDKFEVLYWK